jgi:subtilisin family serine protease
MHPPHRQRIGRTLLWLSLLLAACHTTAPEVGGDAPRLLVTFPEDPSELRFVTGGSRRTYYAGDWQVSARVQRQIDALSRRYGLRRINSWPIKSLGVQCVLFEASSGTDIANLVRLIAAEPGVDSVQPQQQFDGLVASSREARVELQLGEHAANLAALHRLTRGASARIGIVDTLVDQHHPDLRRQIARQYPFVGDSETGRMHGTAVAGVIVADNEDDDGVVGIAPDADVYVYGACQSTDSDGARCDTFNLAKALEQALVDHVEVLNLSLAGPYDPLLARLLSQALSGGMIVVAAVGPNDPASDFPASMPGVWAVTGTHAILENAAPATVDACARWIVDPERLSTRAGGGYRFFYGSSMSAAGVSGFAALLRSNASAEQTVGELGAVLLGRPARAPNPGAPKFLTSVRQALLCDRIPATVAEGKS